MLKFLTAFFQRINSQEKYTDPLFDLIKQCVFRLSSAVRYKSHFFITENTLQRISPHDDKDHPLVMTWELTHLMYYQVHITNDLFGYQVMLGNMDVKDKSKTWVQLVCVKNDKLVIPEDPEHFLSHLRDRINTKHSKQS